MSKKVFRASEPIEARSLESVMVAVSNTKTPKTKGQPIRMAPAEIRRLQAEKEGSRVGYQKGYEEGFAEGQKRGFEEALARHERSHSRELEKFVLAMNELSDAVVHALHQWFVQAEQELGGIAVLMAQRIVAQELKTDPNVILSLVSEALKEVTHSSSARIRLSPFDNETLRKHQAELMALAPSLKSIELVVDSSIQGGCIIDTDGGTIDATVSSKLRELAQGVLEAA